MPRSKYIYGYRMKDGNVVIREDEAEVVRWIFNERLGRRRIYSIAKQLHDNKIPHFEKKTENCACMLSHILYDARYKGSDGYPAIVDEDLFEKVQTLKGKPVCRQEEKKKRIRRKNNSMDSVAGDDNGSTGENSNAEETVDIPDYIFALSEGVKLLENRIRDMVKNDNTAELKPAFLDLVAARYGCVAERRSE